MEKKGENKNQRIASTERSGSLGASKVYGLLTSYRKAVKGESPYSPEVHFSAMQEVLETAIVTYSTAMEDVQLSPNTNKYWLQEINGNFDRVVQGAQQINFPYKKLEELSLGFIDRALDFETPRSPFEREAAAKVALAIGGKKLEEAKVQKILDHQNSAVRAVLDSKSRSDRTAVQTERALQANKMIGELDYIVEFGTIPSVAETVTTYAREHGRSIATTSAAAVVAASILAPTLANAAPNNGDITPVVSITPHSKSTSIEASPANQVKDQAAVSIALPSETKNAQPKSISVSNSPVEAVNSTVNVAVPQINKEKDAKASSLISVQTAPEVPPVAVSVINVPKAIDNASAKKEISVDNQVQTPFIAVTPSVDLSTKVETGQPLTIEVAPAPQSSQPDQESSKLSPEQKTVQAILDTIKNGDISTATTTAASMIRLSFRDTPQNAPDFTNGSAVDNVTNKDLVDAVRKLEIVVEKTISTKGGHADANYVNNSLMALAVLDAAANDQSIMKSTGVQSLLSNIKRPDDVYQGKLFDQYVAQAKQTLEANGSALLKGIDTPFVPSVETMYAYSLMAAVSDADQAKGIQAIKDAEAAAAAAAAAAEAQRTNPNQVLQSAIDRAAKQFGWSENERIILQVAAQHGASAAAVAGLGGNVFAESGFDPGKQEYGSGIGFGYIQESYGRRTAMEQAAAAEGANVADPTWQANYIITRESMGRQQRDNSDNEWGGFIGITDPVAAADYWLYNNERAGVPHSSTREAKAAEIFGQINGQVQAIQAEQAAAAAAAAAKAQAEAAAKAKAEAEANSMQKGPDIYNWLRHNESNGKLSANALAPVNSPNVSYVPGPNNLNSDYYNQVRNGEGASLQLNPEAARQFIKLADAFAAQFHKALPVGAAYRSFAGQENQLTYWTDQGEPDNAATPGKSFHGWGLAVDLELANDSEHAWLVANGPQFGWVWPNKSGEEWHFEYMGAAAQGNGNNRPEPGL